VGTCSHGERCEQRRSRPGGARRAADLPDHLGPPLAPPEAADGDVDGSVRCRVERKGGAPRVAHLEVGLPAAAAAGV